MPPPLPVTALYATKTDSVVPKAPKKDTMPPTTKKKKKRDHTDLASHERRLAKRSTNAWRTDLKPNAPFGGSSGPGSGDPDPEDLAHRNAAKQTWAHQIDTPSASAAGIGQAETPSALCTCDPPTAITADHDPDCPLYYAGGHASNTTLDPDPTLDDDRRAERELARRSMSAWARDPRQDHADDGDLLPPTTSLKTAEARAREVSRQAWLQPWRKR